MYLITIVLFLFISFFIILSGTVSIYINTNFSADEEPEEPASPEAEEARYRSS